MAVIDTGVDYNHPDLQANIWTNFAELNGEANVDDDNNGYIDDVRGVDFTNSAPGNTHWHESQFWYDDDPMDDYGHGTRCAGIIAAIINNGIGIAGTAQVQIMPLKVLNSVGFGNPMQAAHAIFYAVKMGANIISMSLGWYEDSHLPELHDAIKYAYDVGVLLVAAAGNENTNERFYPAAWDEVIAVTATDQNDSRAVWDSDHASNFGD